MSCAVSRNTYTPNDFCDHRAASSHAFLWWFFYLLQTKKNLLAFRSWCFDCCPGTTLKTRWMGEQTVNSQSFISVWRKSLHLTAHWTKLFWKQLLAFLFFFLFNICSRYPSQLWNAISSMQNNGKIRWGFYTSPPTCCSCTLWTKK